MSIKYKVLIFILLFEFLFLPYIKPYNHSNIAIDAIGVAVLSTPILVLLYLLKRDKSFSEKKKKIFAFLFWFFVFAYVLGGISKILSITLP